MANLLSTTIDGPLIENEGTGATGEVTFTLPQKGSTVVFESSNTVTFASSAYDASTNKYVVAFRDNTDGGKGKAVVGTPAGDSIVWGTPVQFSTAGTSIDTGNNNEPSIGFCMQYDPDTERILIAWSEGNMGASPGKGTSKVGVVSGTGATGTITFGSEGIFDNGNKGLLSDKRRFAHQMAYDTNQNKMVLTWSPMITGKGGVASVGTIVGGGTNSITWGTPVDVEPVVSGTGGTDGEFSFVSIIYDTASQNIVIAWEGQVNSSTNASFVGVGTVSGTSITFGTKINHTNSDADDSSLGYDPVAQKIILIYTDYGQYHGNSRAGVARVGTVSGSGATATCYLGEPTAFSGIWAAKACDIVYNTTAARHIINYMTYQSGNAGGGTPGATYEHLLAKSAKVTSVTLSCTTTSSSTTVTTADTSSLVVGMSVNGTGMGVGHKAEGSYLSGVTTVTNIASITNSTTFVLDTAATASGTSTLGFTILHDFSPVSSIETSGLQDNINDFNMNISHNTTDNRTLVPRPTGDAAGSGRNGTIIKSTSTGITVDLSTGSFFEVDLESATDQIAELVISNPHASHGSSFVLQITQGSTARNINWENDSKIKWPGGTAPILTTTNNKVDIFSFSTWDNGTTWYGKVIGQNF